MNNTFAAIIAVVAFAFTVVFSLIMHALPLIIAGAVLYFMFH